MPETRLPLAVSAQLVAGLAEAVVETQIVSDGVLPAIWSRLKKGEVLSANGRGRKGVQTCCSNATPTLEHWDLVLSLPASAKLFDWVSSNDCLKLKGNAL